MFIYLKRKRYFYCELFDGVRSAPRFLYGVIVGVFIKRWVSQELATHGL